MRTHGSRPEEFQPVFVVQSCQNRGGDDSVAFWDSMPVFLREPGEGPVGNAGTELAPTTDTYGFLCRQPS